MPSADSVVNVLVRIRVESVSSALARSQESCRALASAAGQAQTNIEALNRSVEESGRTLFRYSFYALWASRVLQAYLGWRLAKGFLQAAGAADTAMARLAAASGATLDQMRLVRDFADEMAARTVFGFNEIVTATEAAVRAGLELAQAMKAVQAAAGLALAEGTRLAEAAEFLSQIMFAFGLSAEQVGKALDMIFEAARQSPYSFGQMTYALRLTMASASALNQSLENLLAMLTIFGRAGVPAAQAATMLNQVLTRLGDPETMAFIETLLEYGAAIPEVLERVGGAMPVLFDVEKGLGDVGEAMIGAAQTVAYLREQAMKEGWLGEFDRALMQILYRVFGIRNIRAFLTLAKVSVEEYRALKNQIAEATGAVEEYLERLSQSWELTRRLAGNAITNVARLVGGGMVALFQPIVRFFAEIANGFFLIGRQIPVLTDFAGAFLGVVATVGAAAAALSSFAIVLTLLHGKLRDIGAYVMRTPSLWAQIGPKLPPGATAYEVGRFYVLGRFLPILRGIAGLAGLVSLAFVAWRHNLGGVQERLGGIREGLEKVKAEIGGIAGGIAEWFKKAREKPETPFQAFFGGMIRALEWTLRAWATVLGRVFEYAIRLISFGARALGAVVRGLLTPLAVIVGLGDRIRGFERLGKAVQTVLSVFMTLWAARKFWDLASWAVRGIRVILFGREVGRWAGLIRHFANFWAPGVRLLGQVVRSLAFWFQTARLLISQFGFWRGVRYTLLLGLSSIARAFKTYLFTPILTYLKTLYAQALLPLLLRLKELVLVAWGYIKTLILEKILKRTTGGEGIIFGIGGALGGGLAGGLGGLLGKLGPLFAKFWWILPLVGVLGGAAYGLYRLFTRPRETPAPAEPTGYQLAPTARIVTRSAILQPAYATTVNISPTIIVPQGTPAEQAQLIMQELQGRLVEFFETYTWRREQLRLERDFRTGLV